MIRLSFETTQAFYEVHSELLLQEVIPYCLKNVQDLQMNYNLQTDNKLCNFHRALTIVSLIDAQNLLKTVLLLRVKGLLKSPQGGKGKLSNGVFIELTKYYW